MAACCFYSSDTGGRVGGTATLGVKGRREGGREEEGRLSSEVFGIVRKPVPGSFGRRCFQSVGDSGAPLHSPSGKHSFH